MAFKYFIVMALLLLASSYAFSPYSRSSSFFNKGTMMQMSSIKAEIQSRDGFVVTDSLRQRVDSKIKKVLSKLSGRRLNSAHVVLHLEKSRDLTKNTHAEGQVCEVICNMKGGETIKSSQSTDDMYASIDLCSHQLAQNLKRHMQKVKDHKSHAHREKVGGALTEDEVDEDGALLDFDEESLLVDLAQKHRSAAQRL